MRGGFLVVAAVVVAGLSGAECAVQINNMPILSSVTNIVNRITDTTVGKEGTVKVWVAIDRMIRAGGYLFSLISGVLQSTRVD